MVNDREQGENEFQELLREIAVAAEITRPTDPHAGWGSRDFVTAPALSVVEELHTELAAAQYALNRAMSKASNPKSGLDEEVYRKIEMVRDDLWALRLNLDDELKG